MSHHRISAGVALILAFALVAPAAATPPGHNGLIVWQREPRDGPPRLWVASPDGSGARQVFRGSARQSEFEGTFSPVDPNVLFLSRGAFPFRPFAEDLYRGDLTTGAVTRVLRARTADVAPAVSPDGTMLAYFAVTPAPLDEDSPPPPQRLSLVGIDGTGARAITPRRVFAVDPDWSPDGTRIVYTELRPVRGGADNRLAIINADGTGRRALTAYGGRDELNPKWAPDGQTILFEELRETGRRSRIMAMPSAGGSPRVIYDSPGWDTNPVPSPDGTRILFTSDQHRRGRDRLNPGFEIYTMAVDGSNVVRLTDNRSLDFFPDWQRLP
jgi:Tol biopolymer transport system component